MDAYVQNRPYQDIRSNVHDPATGNLVNADKYFDAQRAIHKEESQTPYEEMTMPDLARKLAEAEHYGDKTSTENIEDVLLAKMYDYEAETASARVERPEDHNTQQRENLSNRIFGVRDRELERLRGGSSKDSAPQGDDPKDPSEPGSADKNEEIEAETDETEKKNKKEVETEAFYEPGATVSSDLLAANPSVVFTQGGRSFRIKDGKVWEIKKQDDSDESREEWPIGKDADLTVNVGNPWGFLKDHPEFADDPVAMVTVTKPKAGAARSEAGATEQNNTLSDAAPAQDEADTAKLATSEQADVEENEKNFRGKDLKELMLMGYGVNMAALILESGVSNTEELRNYLSPERDEPDELDRMLDKLGIGYDPQNINKNQAEPKGKSRLQRAKQSVGNKLRDKNKKPAARVRRLGSTAVSRTGDVADLAKERLGKATTKAKRRLGNTALGQRLRTGRGQRDITLGEYEAERAARKQDESEEDEAA
jgi:hypothetical protein